MTSPSRTHAPLAGVKILESSSYLTGPWTSTQLADLGAEVIKVEPPGGDAFRKFGHGRQGWSALWVSSNRGKRSIVLDLKDAGDLATMKQLVQDADVLVENWRPHVADKLGLGQQVVEALNPRLIRLSITGFGPTGPLSGAPAYDSLIQGHTGMVDLLTHTGRPDVAPYWVVDKVVATFGAQAILAALYQRERTGKGGAVSLPMLDVMAYFNFPDMFQHRTFVGDDSPWKPAFCPVVKTADGHLIITPVSGAQMSRTLKAVGREDLKAELKAAAPAQVADLFYRRLGEVLATNTSAHWLAAFAEHDLPVAPVRSLEEHLHDPQVAHNQLYREVPTPVGPARAVRYPAAFGGQQVDPAGSPPQADQHGQDIRAALASQPA